MTHQPAADVQPLLPPDSFLSDVAAMGLAFDPGDVEQLGRYLALLLRANESFNLTAIRDAEEAWQRHILDSLSLIPLLVSSEARRVIDVGSGGGLPGVPLAITLPDMHVTLLEATGKKARFLKETTRALALSNVSVSNDRAETIGRDREQHREQYDVVIARAVGRLSVLLELTVPLAREGSLVLAIKGAKADEEIEEAKRALHLMHAKVIDQVSTTTGRIVVIEKLRRTPKLYPRRPGEPKRAPL